MKDTIDLRKASLVRFVEFLFDRSAAPLSMGQEPLYGVTNISAGAEASVFASGNDHDR